MKIILIITAFLAGTTAFAQKDTIPKTGNFDIGSLTDNIASKLSTALELTKEQQPRVTGAVNTFLIGKSKIIYLSETDKQAYQQKFQPLAETFKKYLQGILLQKQMVKFPTLQPATGEVSNVLYHLFY